MVTIKDIAEKTGFSICTVSRAMSGKGYIKQSTKAMILETAKQLNYQPNRAAVSLKTGRTNTLALVIPDVTNMYYPRLMKYIEKYASENDFMVYLCSSDNRLELEKKCIQTIISNQPTGVIITPCTNEHEHIKELKKYGIPYIYLNRIFEDDKENCIQSNNFSAAYECTKYLIERGFRHIGGLFRSFDNMIYEQRYHGMMQAIQECGEGYRVSAFLDMDEGDEGCRTITRAITSNDRPEAFFAANDMLALAVYKAAYTAGLKIPDDISVVGYDNIILSDRLVPPLTTYFSPAREMCRAAVEMIMARINGREAPQTPVLNGWIVERDSVRDAV